jgi:hypothetical protein
MSRHTFGSPVRAMIFFLFSQAAPVAILLSALFSERYSLGARWVFSFSRCCYLISVLSSHLFGGSWAPGLSRSHLDSAAELGCSDQNFLGHRTHRFLAIAQWSIRTDLARENGLRSKKNSSRRRRLLPSGLSGVIRNGRRSLLDRKARANIRTTAFGMVLRVGYFEGPFTV